MMNYYGCKSFVTTDSANHVETFRCLPSDLPTTPHTFFDTFQLDFAILLTRIRLALAAHRPSTRTRLPRGPLKDHKGNNSLPTPTSKAVLPVNGVVAALALCLALHLATCRTLTLLLQAGSLVRASRPAVLVLLLALGKTSLSPQVALRVALDLKALLRLESPSQSQSRLPLVRMERLLPRLLSNLSHLLPPSRPPPPISAPTARLAPTKGTRSTLLFP